MHGKMAIIAIGKGFDGRIQKTFGNENILMTYMKFRHHVVTEMWVE